MSTSPAFPWALRLELEGAASLRLEREGRWFRFDPLGAAASWAALGEIPPLGIRADDVIVLSWNEQERLAGAIGAVEAGLRPTVLASQEILDWLAERGELDAIAVPAVVDGVRVDFLPYAPIAYAEGADLGWKIRSALASPARAARRMLARARLPACAPVATELRFADGRRFVHLNLALHKDTPTDWLALATRRFSGADWLVAGVDHGHEDAFLEHIGAFQAKRLLVADLVSDVRRALGLPTRPLTPIVDRLAEAGIDAYVFASRSSFRFE